MAKRRVGSFLGVLVVLWFLASTAHAEPIPVCWRPAWLKPGSTMWSVTNDGKGAVMVGAAEFAIRTQNRRVYVYKPDAPVWNNALLQGEDRRNGCTPLPVEKPAADAAKPPEPPKGGSGGKEKDESVGDDGEDAEEGAAEADDDEGEAEAPQPTYSSPRVDEYEEYRKRRAKHRSNLPEKTASALPWNESALPAQEEQPVLPKLEVAQRPLPVLNARPGSGGKGLGEQKTATEKAIEQFVLFAGALTLQLDEDLHRPDGKKFGIVGGRNEDGPDNPATQVIAAVIQLAPAAAAQVEQFMKKAEEAIAKKTPLVVNNMNELGEEAAEALAKEYGEGIAIALQKKGAIGPYKLWQKFTDGLGGRWEAHHILEVQWFKKWGKKLGDPNLGPSVILTNAEHKVITDKLKAGFVARFGKEGPRTLDDVWKVYQDVYEQTPHWLKAIKSYFNK
jgi:hypothetical protein